MLRTRDIAAFAVLAAMAAPGAASAQDDGLSSSDERPPGLIAQLSSRYQVERSVAEDRLVALGESAVPTLLQALDHASWQTRMGAVRALGRIGAKQAVAPLVAKLHAIAGAARDGHWRDPAPAYEMCIALTRIRPEGTAQIEAIATGKVAPLVLLQSVAAHALAEGVRAPIMAHFAAADQDGSYKGRFAELRKYGHAGTLLLLRVAHQLISGRSEYQQHAKMAIQALGDGNDPAIKDALLQLRKQLTEQGEIPDDAETDLAAALHRHGAPEMLAEMIESLERSVRPVAGSARGQDVSTLARLYLKAERFDDAVRLYERQAQSDPQDWATAYYNAACAHSQAHQGTLALAALRKAVEGPPHRRTFSLRGAANPYSDVQWMQKDGDLTFIREHPGFWYLVAAVCGRHHVGTTRPETDAYDELLGHLRRAAKGGYKIPFQADYERFFAGMHDVPPEPGEFIAPDIRTQRREFEQLWRSMGGTSRH